MRALTDVSSAFVIGADVASMVTDDTRSLLDSAVWKSVDVANGDTLLPLAVVDG